MKDKQNVIKMLEEGRAKFAYEKASEAKDSEYAQKYKSHVKRVPMLIKTNGLGPTLAYIKCGDEAYKAIYRNLTDWLLNDAIHIVDVEEDLVKTVVSLDSTAYRAVTNEVLAFFNWLRRFADGLIESEDEKE